jgi:hypothetical protein
MSWQNHHASGRSKKRRDSRQQKSQKHTTCGIPRWSPTLVLVARFNAYVWQSGRDAQFSLTYGRMCSIVNSDLDQNFVIWHATYLATDAVLSLHR